MQFDPENGLSQNWILRGKRVIPIRVTIMQPKAVKTAQRHMDFEGNNAGKSEHLADHTTTTTLAGERSHVREVSRSYDHRRSRDCFRSVDDYWSAGGHGLWRTHRSS